MSSAVDDMVREGFKGPASLRLAQMMPPARSRHKLPSGGFRHNVMIFDLYFSASSFSPCCGDMSGVSCCAFNVPITVLLCSSSVSLSAATIFRGSAKASPKRRARFRLEILHFRSTALKEHSPACKDLSTKRPLRTAFASFSPFLAHVSPFTMAG